ncbi:uncharacterized protein LOC120985547 [Bufo bufo]|uniref:uncharacterized protein LOC120985547 n=1 Tax=Bufo bufo TaxID=8384 RepID=UPI001ABEC459|nr:uncharacterized protein LOC120985547 [Bufo bufo]
MIRLPVDKQLALQRSVRLLLHRKRPSICCCMQVLGAMVASFEAIPFAQFRSRPLQLAILACWDKSPESLDRHIVLPTRVHLALRWWLRTPTLQSGKSFLPVLWTIITTDASLQGWGGVFPPRMVQVSIGVQTANQHLGTPGHSSLLGPSPEGPANMDSIRQCHGCGLYQPPGGYPQLCVDEGVGKNPEEGGVTCPSSFSTVHSGSGELGGGFPQPDDSTRENGPCPGGVRTDLSPVGSSRGGLDGVQLQPQTSHRLLSHKRSQGVRRRRSGSAVGRVFSSVCVPASPSPASCSTQDQDGGRPGDPNRPGLAPSGVVLRRPPPPRGRTVAPSTQGRSALSGTCMPSTSI